MSEAKETDSASEVADFTSSIPWGDFPADSVVISCSDHRFRKQTDEFLEHFGYKTPHVIKFPAGPALLHPLTAVLGVFTKAVDQLLEKAIAAAKPHGSTEPIDVMCVSHEHCAAYKAGGVKLVDLASRHLTGKSVKDLQIEHLKKTAKRVSSTFGNVRVRAYMAEVVDDKLVHFKRVEF